MPIRESYVISFLLPSNRLRNSLVLRGRMGFKNLHRFFGLAFGMVSSLHVRCKVPIIHLIKLRIFFVIVIFTTWMYTFFELHLKWDLLLGFQV